MNGILLKLDENRLCVCLLLLIWDQFMVFHMSTYTSTLPSPPCGITLSDSSACPDYLRLLWNPRISVASQKSSHLPHLRANVRFTRGCTRLPFPDTSWPSHPPSLASTNINEHLLREPVGRSFCPLQLTFLVMNVEQQRAPGAFRG